MGNIRAHRCYRDNGIWTRAPTNPGHCCSSTYCLPYVAIRRSRTSRTPRARRTYDCTCTMHPV
eukprot:scaffold430755_cov27-Prasinocladus_malaysianus.AAC.1